MQTSVPQLSLTFPTSSLKKRKTVGNPLPHASPNLLPQCTLSVSGNSLVSREEFWRSEPDLLLSLQLPVQFSLPCRTPSVRIPRSFPRKEDHVALYILCIVRAIYINLSPVACPTVDSCPCTCTCLRVYRMKTPCPLSHREPLLAQLDCPDHAVPRCLLLAWWLSLPSCDIWILLN